ncbi:hypothetical protein COCOBI_12-1080 [Coccomyxa sp. Obi]|nr:hypothetical protein COCOBI_12-1080 [Coccomyxa sp. Obi]
MVYRKSLKGSRSKVNAEIPNLSLEEAKAILGETLCSKAKNGPKQLQASAGYEDISEVLGAPTKSLRYGSSLYLDEGVKFTYDKAGRTLKVSGFYKMS